MCSDKIHLEEKEKMLLPLKLQLFAEDKDDQDDDDKDDKDDKDDDDEGDEEDEEEKPKFSQKDLKKVGKKEKQKGKNSVLKALGVKTLDEALEKINSGNKQSKKSKEKEKDDDGSDNEVVSKLNTEKAAAEAKAKMLEDKFTLLTLGVKPKCVDDVLALVSIKVDDDNDLEDVVESLKKKYPSFFSGSEDDEDEKDDSRKKGTGSSKSGKKGTYEVKGIGSRLGKQQTQSDKKSSYFDN